MTSLRLYPVVKDIPDARDHLAAPPGRSLPATANLGYWLGPVKDQGQLGACTGFAFCGLREFLYRKFAAYEKTPVADKPTFSPLFLYYLERAAEGDIDQDSGAQSRTGLQVLAKAGICLEEQDPYHVQEFAKAPTPVQIAAAQQFRIGAYHRVVDLDTLKSVLASGYCASLAIEVYASFESPTVATTGTVPLPAKGEGFMGGHEVLAYGYDDSKGVVLVRNSWGLDWGQAGNFTLPYAYFETHVMDMWTAHLGKPW